MLNCLVSEPKLEFCAKESAEGKLINIVLRGDEFSTRETALTVCNCRVTSSSKFKILLSDFRRYNNNTRVCLSGITNPDTNCKSDLSTPDTGEEPFSGHLLQLLFDVKPEFMWVIVQTFSGMFIKAGIHVDVVTGV